MLVLGIESTCDETACALVENGTTILSNCIASQADLHEVYGGVVPELASRRHIDAFPLILKQAMAQAHVSFEEIDLISVAKGPGLIGALLIGLNFAKALSLSRNIPFVGVNHVEAHLISAMMGKMPSFPAIGLVVSGGHTSLLLVKGIGSYEIIGQTQDDAVGEAFDKVATLLDLAYPGGPKIEVLAKGGNPFLYPFKTGKIKNRLYDFSFSGLKTSVLYHVKGQNGTIKSDNRITEQEKKDVAASFQHAAFSDIVNKSLSAAKEYQCESIIIGGGVSQNNYLRQLFDEGKKDIKLYWPPVELCQDNGAMIAALGFHEYKKRGKDSYLLEPLPRIPLGLPCTIS